MNADAVNPASAPRKRAWVRVVLFLVLAVVVWQTVQMLLIIFVGVLGALFLRGLSDWVSRHTGLPAGWALGVVIVGLLGSTALAGYLLAPEVDRQFNKLQVQLPQAWQHLEEQLGATDLGSRLLHAVQPGGSSGSGLRTALGHALGVLSSSFGVVAGIVVCVFVALYLAASPGTYFGGAVRLVPPLRRARMAEVLEQLGCVLRRWLLGRILLMVLNAAATAGGLSLLGVPLAVTLGIISGLLNFVPNFGPVAAAIPAVLLAWVESPSKALYVLAFYVGYQALDGYVLTPLVQKQTIALPPALTIISQALLGVLFGVMGVLLAVPLAAVVMVLTRMLYLQDRLEEQVSGTPGGGA